MQCGVHSLSQTDLVLCIIVVSLWFMQDSVAFPKQIVSCHQKLLCCPHLGPFIEGKFWRAGTQAFLKLKIMDYVAFLVFAC